MVASPVYVKSAFVDPLARAARNVCRAIGVEAEIRESDGIVQIPALPSVFGPTLLVTPFDLETRTFAEFLLAAELATSMRDAKTLIQQGGVRLNRGKGEPFRGSRLMPTDFLEGVLTIAIGKGARHVAQFQLCSDAETGRVP